MTSSRTDCNDQQNDIDRAFAGELPEAQRIALMRHVDECDECRDYYAVVEEISSAKAPEPDDAGLLAMRREVIRTIRREADQPKSWLSWFARPQFATLALALVAGGLLFALGLTVGRGDHSEAARAVTATAQPASSEIVLARHIGAVAAKNRRLSDIENSPYRYTNVEITEESAGRLRLSFDVSRHLDLSLDRSDPLVTEVLVQSVLDPTSVGTQLTAISEAGNVLDARVRGALIRAMLNDPNLGVRLQAQSRLSGASPHADVTAAMLRILEHEASVQMRLVAIDYLTRSRIDPKRLEKAVHAGEPEGRTAVLVRARSYTQSF